MPADVDRAPAVDETALLVARARKVLANGELAMSARPLLFGESGVYPQFVSRAEGCRLTDTTGSTSIDWVMGWGSALLGYGRPEIEKAIREQLAAAATLTLPHALEVEVAERLVSMIPCAEMVAFGKNGSDAVTAAVRLARATTERDVILQYGYHGFHDWFAVEDRGIRGIPAAQRGLVHSFPYNDLGALEALFARFPDKVAAVLMEPFQVEMPRDGYLEGVQELARRHGALLIFDEMVTGFRVARGGAQELTGVVPDLACFGKALANGMPLSALVGPRALMATSDSVGVDMGCRGETLSLAAARAALDVHAGEPIADRVAEIGRSVKASIEGAAERDRVPLRLVGHPARLELEFQDVGAVPKKTALGLFIQACMHRGIVTNGLMFATAAHDQAAVEETIEAARGALRVIRRAAEGGGAALPPPFGPSSVGFLDSAEIVGGQLELRGWILPLGLPPETVEIVDSQGETFAAEILPRPDVAQAYPSIAGATRSGFLVRLPWDSREPGSTWTIRSRRSGRLVFRARLVAGIRNYRRSMPREMGDGHVIEF